MKPRVKKIATPHTPHTSRTVHIASVAALAKFAREYASSLRGGRVLGLVGDLGAGKTTFVQSLAKALGVTRAVKSPTFILMQIFSTNAAARRKGIARICHVDAYRLKDSAELRAIGFSEFAEGPETLCLVEWADRLPELHGMPGYQEITFDFGKREEERVLQLGT